MDIFYNLTFFNYPGNYHTKEMTCDGECTAQQRGGFGLNIAGIGGVNLDGLW